MPATQAPNIWFFSAKYRRNRRNTFECHYVVQVTETTREVTIELDATKQSMAVEGAAVTVELPDGSTAPAKITEVGRVAETEESDIPGAQGTPKITVIVTLDDPSAGGDLDAAPVTVRFTTATAEGVLAVPVRAVAGLRWEPGSELEQLFAEQRFRYFDFTEGDGAHKALFGTHQVQCATLFLLAPSIANRAVLTSHRAFNAGVEATGAWLERIGAKAKIRKLLRG